MNELIVWNILAMILLAFPSYIILAASWEAIYSGMNPYLFLGLFAMIGIGYCVMVGNLIYFKEEGKKDG